MNKPSLYVGLVFLLSLIISSCSFRGKTLDNLSTHYKYLSKYKAEEGTSLESETLSWERAKELLIQNNIQLQRSRRQVNEASKRRKRYWRNYIPGLQGSANIGSRIFEIDSLTLEDVALSTFIRLRLPNPINLPGELQALSLNEYSTQKRYELQERNAIVRLYRTFLRYEQLEKQIEKSKKPLDLKLETSGAILSALKGKINKRFSHESLIEQQRNLEKGIAESLQLQGALAKPDVESLPRLNYAYKKSSYFDDDSYGKLAVQLLATSLESSRLRIKQSQLSKYPSLNISASAPRLYSSTSSDNEFDPSEISLFGGVSKSFDWMGRRNDQIKFSKEDYLYAVRQAQSRIQTDKDTLRRASSRIKRLNRELKDAKENRKKLAELINDDLRPQSYQVAINQILKLDEEIDRVDYRLRLQEVEFWVWDEKKWN